MTITPKPTVPSVQADVTLNQANPVSGTTYTILDTTNNVRILGIEVIVTWTVQPTPLEIHIAVDGQSYSIAFANPVSVSVYRVRKRAAPAAKFDLLAAAVVQGIVIEGKSVKIEAETTGGTVQNLSGTVWYSRF